MAVNYQKNIVTNGLVLCLDASDIKSYPRSGDYWFDRSGNGNSGILLNSPVFDNNNGGSFTFDDVESSIIVSHVKNMNFPANQTICMWIKPVTGAKSTVRTLYFSSEYGSDGSITYETDGTLNYSFGSDIEDYIQINSGFTVEENETAFISVTRNQTNNTCIWYKNNRLVTISEAGGFGFINTYGSSSSIGNSTYASVFLGNIYNCLIYNKELTDVEILQNYNSSKGRFGL